MTTTRVECDCFSVVMDLSNGAQVVRIDGRRPSRGRSARRRLSRASLSVRQARQFASDVASRWNLEARSEDLVTVISELVANAVSHGIPEGELLQDPMDLHPPLVLAPGQELPPCSEPIDVQLIKIEKGVLCLVCDPGADPPRRRSPADWHESGRGLIMLDELCCGWGWLPLASRGKAVWAVLPCAPADSAHEAVQISRS